MGFPYIFPFYFEPPATASPQIKVQIAFASTPFAATPSWTDVSSDVRSFSVRRGRQSVLDRMQVGTAVIELKNTSGNYYAENTGGDYYGNVKTMKRVNIQASPDGGTTWGNLYTGYIEAWRPGWAGKAGKGPIMTIECSDGLKCLSYFLLNSAGYAQEASGTRIANILNSLGWMAADRALDAGQYLMIATGALANVNALDHAQAVGESELGILFVAANGNMVFEDRSHRTTSPHDTSQSTWGDDLAYYQYSNVEFLLDEMLLYNQVRATRSGGTEQVANNTTSQGTYGVRSLSRTGLLLTSDPLALDYATLLCSRYAGAVTAVKSITVISGRSPGNTLQHQINYEISTRITIRLSQAEIAKDYFIEGISQDWSVDSGNLVTNWQLSDATQYLYQPGTDVEEILRPTGAGDHTGIQTLVGAATHWEAVAEATPDEDTSYVDNLDQDYNDYDVYATANMSAATATITSVTIVVRCRRTATDIAVATKTAVKTEGGVHYGSSENMTTSYVEYSTVHTVNPQTGVAWTVAEVNSMQIGVYLDADAGPAWSAQGRCTQVYAIVAYKPSW